MKLRITKRGERVRDFFIGVLIVAFFLFVCSIDSILEGLVRGF